MNLIKSTAMMVVSIYLILLSHVLATELFPNGVYLFIYKWPSWPDRYLIGSNKEAYETLGIVDVTFKPRTYDQYDQWRIHNNNDGSVYIQNVRTTRYLGSGHKFNCTAPPAPKTACASSLLSIGDRWEFVEHWARKGRYHLQLKGYGGSLWKPIIGPAGPSDKPLETAIMLDKYSGREMIFEIKRAY